MKPDRRGSWYLLTASILGVVLGLVYSWQISPVRYVDAPPSALRADYKNDYRALVALAYLYSSDLLRAESRLAQLKDDNPVQAIAIQAQQAQAENHPRVEVEALEKLAADLAADISSNTGNIPSPQPFSTYPVNNQPISTPTILAPTNIPPTLLPLAPTVSVESVVTPTP